MVSVECLICVEPFSSHQPRSTPRILPCGHSYCTQCITHMLENSFTESNKLEVKCPRCRRLITAPHVRFHSLASVPSVVELFTVNYDLIPHNRFPTRIVDEEKKHAKQITADISIENKLCYLTRGFPSNTDFSSYLGDGDELRCCSVFMGKDGNAEVFTLYEDGLSAWTCCPALLDKKFRYRSKHHSKGVFVAIGTEDRYFVKFQNGRSEWVSNCKEFDCSVKENPSSPRFVAFGPNDSWFVLFEDDSFDWYNIPSTLHNKLHSRKKDIPKVKLLAMSSDGGWFVEFTNGSFSHQGLHHKFQHDLCKANKPMHTILHVSLPTKDSYCIVYTQMNILQ